jgi:hypothetical protein
MGALLVNAAGVATVGAMHAAGTSSLDARPTGQCALELSESARDLVAHSGMALVVVDGTSRSATGSVVTASGPCSLGRCSGSGSGTSDGVALGSRVSLVAA